MARLKGVLMEKASWRNITFLILFSIITMMLASTSVNRYSLKKYPASGDEASLWFQSELFKEGKLWNNSLDKNIMGLFKRHHVVTTEQKEYSKYPPGPSLFFSIIPGNNNGYLANVFFNSVTFIAALLILFEFGFSFFTLLLFSSFFVFSAMTIFNGASWFSHPAAAAFTALALLFIVYGEKRSGVLWFFLAGLIIGFDIFMRPFDAALLLVSISIYYFFELTGSFYKFSAIFKKLFFIFLGILPLFILFLIYQKIYTGSFFKSPYSLYVFSSDLKTGDHIGEITMTSSHYFKYGLGGLTPLWLKEMMKWTNPVVIPAAIFAIPFFWKASNNRLMRLYLIIPIVFIMGYALHNAPGGDGYGPRYYYPAMICWFSLAAFAVNYLTEKISFHKSVGAVILFLLTITTVAITIHNYFAVKENIVNRFSIYSTSEKKLPNGKSLVFVKETKLLDSAFFTRHKPDFSDKTIYIKKPSDNSVIPEIKKLFPDRIFYDYNYDKSSGRHTFKKIIPEAEDEKDMENSDSR